MFIRDRELLGYIQDFQFEFNAVQAGAVLIDPAATNFKRYAITDFRIYVPSGGAAGTIRLYDETNAAGNWLFNQEVDASTNPEEFTDHFTLPFFSKADDNQLKLDMTAIMTARIMLRGYLL